MYGFKGYRNTHWLSEPPQNLKSGTKSGKVDQTYTTGRAQLSVHMLWHKHLDQGPLIVIYPFEDGFRGMGRVQTFSLSCGGTGTRTKDNLSTVLFL